MRREVRQFLGAAGVSGALRVLNVAIGILTTVLLGRMLGVDGLGQYSFAFAFVAILTIPSQFGLPALMVRETAKAATGSNWGAIGSLWRWGASFTAFSSIALSGIAAVITTIVLGPNDPLFWLLSLSFACVPFLALANLSGAALRGLGRTLIGQLAEYVLRPGLFLCLLAIAFFWPHANTPSSAMALQLAASVAALVIGSLAMWRFSPLSVFRAPAQRMPSRSMIVAIVPLGLASGSLMITQSIGLVALGFWSTDADVAVMRVGILGASVVALGLTAVNLITGPRIAHLFHQQDFGSLQRLLTYSSRIVILVAIPCALALILFGDKIFSLLIGEDFSAVRLPLLFLVLGQLINALTASSGTFLTMTGHEMLLAKSSLALMAATAAGSMMLAPTFGASGAAIALSITFAIYNVFLWAAVRRKEGFDTSAIGIFSKYRTSL